MQQVFTTVFDLFGTINKEGFIKKIEGKLLDEIEIVDREKLLGEKFVNLNFLKTDAFSEPTFKNILLNCEKGNNSKITSIVSINGEIDKTLEITFIPLKQNGKLTEKVFFGAIDITNKQKEVEFYKQRSEHFLFAAENAGIGLWFWDLVKDEVFSTPKCNQLFELEPYETFHLSHIFSIVHPDDLQKVESDLRESHENGVEYNMEFRVIYTDGNIHWISSRGKTFFDVHNKHVSMMGSVREITDKKMASEELAVIYEREKKARDEAVRANKAKDFFLAVVSHELRSPLNAILGWTKILLSKEVDAETRINALETIERSAKSQSKLIEDLVDSARITSGKLKLEMRPVNIYEIICNVFNSKKPEAESKNINLEFNYESKNLEVFGDTIRLQQIFTNLLSNAVKFTNDGGKISIDLEKSAYLVQVKIKDDGQGISTEDLPKIFEQFSQGNNKSDDNKMGLGLGLSIANILIQKHEGEIYAESPGHNLGSTFTVNLPLYSDDTDTAEEEKNLSNFNEKVLDDLEILVVEDDYDSRNVLTLFLEQMGAKVDSADSAKEALEILENRIMPPNLIISDIAMPEEDGNSLIKKIRSFEKENFRSIPAIALSAFTAFDNKEKAIESGFQIYHTKPFDPDLLVEEIKSLTEIEIKSA